MRIVDSCVYDADVIIAGGGPAGATCAFYLSKAGYKVLLLDAQVFPRDKVCGDFVGPVAIKELMAMDIVDMDDFKKTNIINQAAVFLDGQMLLTKSIPHVDNLPTYGRVIPREVLDNWILQAAIKAGTKAVTQCRVSNFTVYENAVVVNCRQSQKETSYTAKLLVGADGSSSTIARIICGSKPDPQDRILAVRAYFDNVNCTAQQAELYFSSKSFPGYYWFFPTSATTANVGIGMVLENFPKQEVNLKELLMDLIATDETLSKKIGKGVLRDKVAGWPLSTYNPNAQLVNDRVLLAGDAAGLINSLNGEGIQYAMQSGRWAAETIIDCLRVNNFSEIFLKKYYQAIQKNIGYDMSLSNMVIQFIRNRNLNPVWLKLLSVMCEQARHDEAYANIAGGILAGLVPANEAVTIPFFGKTALQGVNVLVDDVREAFKKGPVAVSALGIHTGAFAISQFAALVQQRNDYMNWAKGIAVHGFSLGGHIMKDIGKRIL